MLMKKHILFLISLLACAACTSEYDNLFNNENRAKPGDSVEFYATVEAVGDDASQTKVFADAQMRVLWNAGDMITIFNKNAYNQPYRFKGNDGDNAGGFEKVSTGDEFSTGTEMPLVYSIYPYMESTKITNDGVMTAMLPAVQHYKEHSFGIGANTMVSVTDDSFFLYKNVGGFLSFKLYGDDISVKSITIKGNNHEKLAGKTTITMNLGGTPTIVLQDGADESVTLTCDEPVALGTTAEQYTEFWMVLPPTEFTQGFTISVTDAAGGIFNKSTNNPVSVTRNNLSRMAPIKVEPEYEFVPFADANFKAYCVERFDTNGNGEISFEEALAITRIEVSTVDIASMKGIEYMPNLTYLRCQGRFSYNPSDRKGLTSLDISKNTALKELYCGNNLLTELDVSNNTALTRINCQGNNLASIDVSKNTALLRFGCYQNQLTSIDVSHNTAMTHFYCDENQLTSLDLSHNTALRSFDCYMNQLTELDISYNTALTYVECYDNQLTSLDISHNTALTYVDCHNNQISDIKFNTVLLYLICSNNLFTSLDASQCLSLSSLDCSSNLLEDLDVSMNIVLSSLSISNNQLSSLNLGNNTALSSLSCDYNQLMELDVSKNKKLSSLRCYGNHLRNLDLSNNTALTSLECYQNQLNSLNVSNCTGLTHLNCDNNLLPSLDVSNNTALSRLSCKRNSANFVIYIRKGQIIQEFSYDPVATIEEKGDPIPEGNIVFTNQSLKDYCVSIYDINQDGEISYAEALLVRSIYCDGLGISSLSEIPFFTNLTSLNCGNNQLTSLDISKNTALTSLTCSNNQLSSLDLSKNTALTSLSCSNNQLTSLIVSANTELTSLYCNNNQLSALDVSLNTALNNIDCSYNQLTELDVSHNTALTNLNCYYNLLTSLVVSNNLLLRTLNCGYNMLTELSVSNNTALTSINCDINQLKSLDVSNNRALTSLSCQTNLLMSLDVSMNSSLTSLYCYNNPYLRQIWLKTNQTISSFGYDSSVTTIKYKD